jgi:hypothetical protein
MRSRGIVFYLAGSRINHLVPVAVASLRKHYEGPICFIIDPEVSPEMRKAIDSVPDCTYLVDNLEHGLNCSKIGLWCRKAWHHIGQYPFDVNLYYDLDHVWVDTFDESIFDMVEEHELLCTSADKKPSQHSLKKRAAEQCVGHKLQFFHAINGGCAGAVKGSSGAHAWVNMIEKTKHHPVLARNPEEFAMCILKAKNVAGTAPYKWSMPISPKNFQGDKLKEELPPHLALHCTRGTFYRSKEWCKTFMICYNTNFMGLKEIAEGNDRLMGLVKKGLEVGI